MGFEGFFLVIVLLHWAEKEECEDWGRDWSFFEGCPAEVWEPPQDP